jgi:hypothetical protein
LNCSYFNSLIVFSFGSHDTHLEQLAEDWNQSVQTKEQIDASIQSRQEAAIKRERSLAYAFTHQVWLSKLKFASDALCYTFISM